MKKIWIDLVVLNGRVRQSQTQSLIECGNRTFAMAISIWMEHNHTGHWSAGKKIYLCLSRFIILIIRVLRSRSTCALNQYECYESNQ